MADKKQVKVEMVFEKETKSTYRFKAIEDGAPVSTLYMDKTALPGANTASVVEVIVRVS